MDTHLGVWGAPSWPLLSPSMGGGGEEGVCLFALLRRLWWQVAFGEATFVHVTQCAQVSQELPQYCLLSGSLLYRFALSFSVSTDAVWR